MFLVVVVFLVLCFLADFIFFLIRKMLFSTSCSVVG